MKQITSLWLLVLFMASTTLIAQNTSTGLASQKAAAAKFKTEQQQNLNAEIQPGVIPGVNQTGGDDYSKYVIYHGSRAELYDNGPLITAEGVGPGGTDYSELQDASLGMGTYGAGCQISAGNSIADDFEVTETWNIDSFTFYSYQTGSGTTSTLNDVRVQIYDGDPSAGGTVIWGNLTTNLMTSTAWINAYRVLESSPDVARPIMEIVAGTSGLTLSPGTYWVEMMIGGTGTSGPWAPAVTIVGQTTTGNSIQKTSTGWAPLMDVGPQGLPFVINGTGGQQANKDVGISAIPQPATGVNLTATEAIAITIRNYGLNAQSNIPWTVNWNGPTGAGSANGTFAGPLAPGSTATVNLTQTANLSTHGSYTFTACTALAGDENAANDCKNKTVSNNLPEYCPASTTTQDEYIANVLCGTIDNSSGWQGGVANYTAISTAIAAGQSEAIIVTNGNPWSSDKVTVWVDWNMSYTFDEGDEKFVLVSSGGGLTFTGAIVVPTGTPEGDYRMRVRMSYSTDPTPCGVMSYGEVEDYTIHVGQAAAKDVGVSALNMGGFYQPGVVSPKATVKNFGSATQTFNVTLTIGSYTSTKSVAALVSGATQEVTFDNWNATVGSYTAEACTQLAGDENPANNCKSMGITVAEGNFVFGYNAYDPSGVLAEGPVTFDIVNPGGMSLLAPTSSAEFIAGATYANGIWYGCMYTGGLYTIDTQTGAMVLVGPSADLSGLAFDGTTMYGASVTDLYTVNMATGASTLIGPMGNAQGLMIGIACDAAGNLYGYDIGDDNFYSINKTTGAATIVGPLGYNFNYAQDMAYDKVNNVCYIAGYTTTGALFSVNVATGAATQLGLFPGGAEITGFAIPDEGTTPPVGTPPINFTANYTAGTGVATTWEMPESGQWVRWDNGENWGSLGLEEAGTFWAAARWETSDLAAFDGQYLTQVNLFPVKYNVNPTIKLMIWEGANAANLVYEQVLTGLTWDEFNTVNLTTMHQIDASKELMVGFEITHEVGEYPLGYDEGPAIAGKGDMISLDGIEFVSMSTEYEIDNNFNIGIYVEEETDGIVGTKQIIARNAISNPSATFVTQTQKVGGANLADGNRALEGFNVYRNGVKVNTDPIPAAARAYTDVFSAPGTYTYNAKAIYTAGLSDPSNSVEVIIGGAGGGIVVNPTSFTEFHPVAQITTKTLTVTNTGTTPLTWGVTASTNTKQAGSTVSSDPIEDQRILNERLAAEGHSNAVVLSMANTNVATPSPYQTDDDVIRYDNGVNDDAIGLTAGGTFEVAAYWPASSMGQYAGKKLSKVEVYINDVPNPFILKVYGQGSSTVPGALLHQQTVAVTGTSWNVIDLSTQVDITGGDLWVGYSVTHAGGTFPAGCDAGPAVAGFGDMISLDGVSFESMAGLDLNYNWNIASTLIDGGPALTKDVGVSAIVQPTTGVNLTGAEAIVITIKNYGTDSQSNIPWTVNWNGPTGAGSANGTFAGPLAGGATANVNLTQTANLSALGSYTFTACTALTGDENAANNCKDKTVSNNLPEYCPASTTYEDEYISNVLCGAINNTSAWQGGVADYTAMFAEISAGASEPITVANGNPWASDKVTCWVDWDMSYTFDEGAEKFVLTSNGGGANFTGNIAVPAGTPNGDYRMRVRMSYSTDPTPCGVMSYGEVEDYTIHVGGGTTTAWLSVPENTGGTLAPGGSAPVTVTFNSNGLPDGTYNGILDVTSNDPNNPLVIVPATLVVGEPTVGIIVTPMVLNETHAAPPQQTTKNLTFKNTGDTPLDVNLTVDLGGKAPDAFTMNPETYAKILAERQASEGIVPSTGRAPYTEYIPTGGDLPLITLGREMAFAYNAYDASGALVEGPITFDLASPGSLTQLAPTSSGDFIAGADWADGTWYGCMYGGGLYTIDDASGAMTLVGSSPDLSGLAWDGTTMYGASTTALYTIDLATGAGTMIGPMGNNALMIGIAANADGEIYGYDIGDDNFYHINKTTGAATVVGSLGFDFNYAQDMAFDRDNGICYLAGYTTTGGLYTVNVNTGAATLVGNFAGGAEVTGFAIPYTSGPPLTKDLSLSSIVSPSTGVNLTNSESVVIKIKNNGTAAQSNFPWTVTWNGPTGAGSANGTYSGSLAAGATADITAGTANLSTYGVYTFEACVNLAGDENPANNCKSKNVTNLEPSLCVDGLYSSGCSFGDGLIAWSLANINVPNIPCAGTPPWYHDYRDMVHELVAGETYTLTVQAGYTSTYFDVWIDFNDDLVLTNDELIINDAQCASSNTPYTFDFTVPANAPAGDHVLRFRTNWTAPVTDPCATYSYGNCCDFKANTGEGTTTAWLWVAEGDLSFTLPANGGQKIVPVHFDSEGLSIGTIKNGGINVASNDPNTPLLEVDATLTVGGGGTGLTVNPTALNETHENAPEITTQILNLTNNTGAPVSWTLATFAGAEGGVLNIAPEVSTETPVYTGQVQVESQPGVTPGEIVEGPAYTNFAYYNGNRGELYNNGGFVTAVGVGPGGTDYSELQDASLGMGTYGSGCQVSAGNSIADDFVVTENWTIESFTFYSYQTGSGTTSTINDARVQIYNGNPSAGGTVIWGNLTSNLMTSTSWTNAYRVLESAPATNRPIFKVVASTPGLTLAPGTYWVEMTLGGTGASGPWAPPVTVVGQTTTGNSIQKTSTGWAPLVDVGPQGLPFIITGTTAVAPWLTATPVSGTLANGQSIPITVTYNSEGLSEGVHNGTVTISSNQPDIVVPVTLTVAPPTGIEPGPTNLAYSIVDFFDVNLTWDAPAGGGFNPAWITYSTGAFTNSVGTNGAANFDVAARWTPADLAAYPGGSVTKVDFVPGEPGNISTYTIKIWQGSGNPTLKYSQLVTTVTADVWNTVVLNEAYQIDLTQELWIGFNCNTTAGFPAGCDDGPQVEGKGNMMFWEGAWTTLTQLAPTLTYNWNIKGYLEAGMQVEGYNVYRKGTSGSFALIGSTNATTLTYLDNNLNLGTYYYHVKAQYAAGLSVPSNQVQVDITSISDPSGAASALQIYPNPAKDQFTIKSESELQSVRMVSYTGQVIFNRKATGNELLIYANEFAKGVYTLQIETKDGRSVHKVIIQ